MRDTTDFVRAYKKFSQAHRKALINFRLYISIYLCVLPWFLGKMLQFLQQGFLFLMFFLKR
jgi:hypothetical protein